MKKWNEKATKEMSKRLIYLAGSENNELYNMIKNIFFASYTILSTLSYPLRLYYEKISKKKELNFFERTLLDNYFTAGNIDPIFNIPHAVAFLFGIWQFFFLTIFFVFGLL